MSLLATLALLLLFCFGSEAMEDDDAAAGEVCQVMEEGLPTKSLILGGAVDTTSTAVYEGIITTDAPIPVASASKLVTGVLFMRLVEKGLVGIHNPVSDYLDWWTTNQSDPRSRVTMFHLMTQTSGFGDGSMCPFDNTTTPEACSKAIYEEGYGNFSSIFGPSPFEDILTDGSSSSVEPGRFFLYCESTFVLAGYVMSSVTNMTFNELFFTEIVLPSGMNPNASLFAIPTPIHPQPGGGLFSTGKEYSKFLQAYYGGRLVNETSMEFMETPHTLLLNATMDPTSTVVVPPPDNSTTAASWGDMAHYGIGCWIMCAASDDDESGEECSGHRIMHSLGFGGVLPWVDRTNAMYWGLIVDFEYGTWADLSTAGMFTSIRLLREVLPAVTEEVIASISTSDTGGGSPPPFVDLCVVSDGQNISSGVEIDVDDLEDMGDEYEESEANNNTDGNDTTTLTATEDSSEPEGEEDEEKEIDSTISKSGENKKDEDTVVSSSPNTNALPMTMILLVASVAGSSMTLG